AVADAGAEEEREPMAGAESLHGVPVDEPVRLTRYHAEHRVARLHQREGIGQRGQVQASYRNAARRKSAQRARGRHRAKAFGKEETVVITRPADSGQLRAD